MTAKITLEDLACVLEPLLSGVHVTLGDDLVGLYVQGSFALGDADAHSDVDFIAVTKDEITDDQVVALHSLHGRLFLIECPWAQHLEGSYVPRASLRRKDAQRRSYWYVDNGATVLVRDNHCNTDVVRWILRERGVRLWGPDPRTLIDKVSRDRLRREALEGIPEHVAWAREPTVVGPMSRWKQPFLVTTFCRILYTLARGRVPSKRAALEWARDELHVQWRSLVEQAIEDRPDPWLRVHEPADEAAIRETLAFADWVAASTYGWTTLGRTGIDGATSA